MRNVAELHQHYMTVMTKEINTKEEAKRLERYAIDIAMVDALEKIYRVEVFDDKLIVLSFGMEMEDLDGSYKSIDELPQWMRDRLHVLSMMDYKPPTTTVKGVGRRISREVFWVVSE
jgi:hypothetical protein